MTSTETKEFDRDDPKTWDPDEWAAALAVFETAHDSTLKIELRERMAAAAQAAHNRAHKTSFWWWEDDHQRRVIVDDMGDGSFGITVVGVEGCGAEGYGFVQVPAYKMVELADALVTWIGRR